MLNSTDFSTFLIPVIYHHLDLGMNSVPSLRSTLFNVQDSSLAEEKGTGLGGMSPDEWDVYKNSGSQGLKGRLVFDQLYTQTYTHQEYPVRVVIQESVVSTSFSNSALERMRAGT